jgi:hypothetical protein
VRARVRGSCQEEGAREGRLRELGALLGAEAAELGRRTVLCEGWTERLEQAEGEERLAQARLSASKEAEQEAQLR